MSVRVFGLTGGLASGKSTVARRFRERGVDVLDADQIAREVVERGSRGLAAIVEAFGSDVLTADGALDRAKLAAVAFADEAKRRTLNSITHPLIRHRTVELIAELDGKGVDLACYEAALLVENRLQDAFRPLVLVAAPEEVQLERAKRRDKQSDEAVRARLAAQLPLADKIAVADYVIDTTGPVESTRVRADEVLDSVCRDLGVPLRHR